MSTALLTGPLAVAGVLCANVVLSEWLARRGIFRHLGSALLVIVVTAVEANLGLIPTVAPESMHPVYEGVFGYVAPLSIFWLLLRVDLREVARAGAQMLILFLIGSAGVALGALAGMRLFGGGDVFGDHRAALAGMFTGTYTGGSINFNAIALHYGVVENGLLYAGANAVDAALTTVWMVVTVVVPRLFARAWPPLRELARPAARALEEGLHEHDRELVAPTDLALVTALGLGAVAASNELAAHSGLPSILIVTTLALIAAQVPAVQRLRGYRSLGLFAVYVFLAVIGALCDLSAVAGLGSLAARLTGLVLTILAVHGTLLFAAARALRLDPAAAAVASQAGVGGGTTALALARSLERPDLAAPGILVGSLGTALGTYLGFWVAASMG
ncbi:MAG TPA: DUF819 family protein [Planctomycetota bacterium]|nr:DUF819 family protein [Planctomycetota bacterium]